MNKVMTFTYSIALLTAAAISAFGQTGQPLDLQSVCKLALQKNPAIAGASASVAQSAAALKKARGTMSPQVTVKSNYGYISEATLFGTTPVLDTNTIVNKIEVVQPIYTGGQLQAGASAAGYAVKAATGAEAAVRSQVVTNAAVSYLRALQASEVVIVAESSVKSLESSYDVAKKLFESGVVTKSDLLRAEVALTGAKELLISASNGHATALAALRAAIGIPQSEAIELAAGTSDSALDGTEDMAAQPRAEVAAAGYGVKAADSQLRAAKGANLPSVGLMADFENQPTGSQFPRLSNTTMVGVQVKFNVFDGGQTKAGIDAANASIAKAKADLDGACQATEFQLAAAKLAVDSAKARVQALATQVSSAEESFRVVETGYREGINVITDVLSVESMLTQSRASKIAADYDLKIAKVNLLLALGQTQKLANTTSP